MRHGSNPAPTDEHFRGWCLANVPTLGAPVTSVTVSQGDPLGRDDYVAYWAQEAREHSGRLNWPPERIPVVLETLEATFGSDWLRGKARLPSRYPMTADPKKHPVPHLIASPHRASVMQLVELALYLRTCSGLRGFSDVVSHLRTAEQFSTARIQLALAHRLVLSGAEAVELEPAADAGRKADLFFRYGAVNHLVECYEPAADRNAHLDDLLHGGVSRILKAAQRARRRVIVRVDLHGDIYSVDAAMRTRIEAAARELVASLVEPRARKAGTHPGFDVEVIDNSGVEAQQVKEMAFSLAGPGAWVIAPGMMKRRDVRGVSRGEAAEVTHIGWFVINHTEPDDLAAMKRIVDSVEAKISQVRRREDDARGLMVVITKFAVPAARARNETLPLVEALRGKVLGAHEGLAGVMLVKHALGKERGPFIGGAFVEGPEGGHLEGLWSTMARRESCRRVIDDWT